MPKMVPFWVCWSRGLAVGPGFSCIDWLGMDTKLLHVSGALFAVDVNVKRYVGWYGVSKSGYFVLFCNEMFLVNLTSLFLLGGDGFISLAIHYL